jgi:type IV pilus assembly protein PilO
MALLPQNPRDQKLFLVGVIALAAVGGYQQLLWSPKNDDLNIIAAHVDQLDSLNRVSKAEAAKGNAVQMRAQADSFDRQLKVLRQLVPTSNEVPALLESVSDAARRVGLELANVIPEGVVAGDDFDVTKYRLRIIGAYHDVGRFLANVGSLRRVVVPINVTMGPTGVTGDRRPRKDEQFLDVAFEIQTYVAKASAPAPAAPKGGAP